MAQPGNNIEQYEPSGWLGTFFLNSLRFPSSLRLFCFSRLADMEEQSEIPLIFCGLRPIMNEFTGQWEEKY